VYLRRSCAALLATIAAASLSPSGRAARDQAATQPSAVVQELIVLEVANCTYCDVFRRDVLPRYKQSERAKDLPIRFVDLNDPAADKLKLNSAVSMVPTVILMRAGAEAGRISGYWGPEAFFKGIARMLGVAD
jgi:hypothetical protein